MVVCLSWTIVLFGQNYEQKTISSQNRKVYRYARRAGVVKMPVRLCGYIFSLRKRKEERMVDALAL